MEPMVWIGIAVGLLIGSVVVFLLLKGKKTPAEVQQAPAIDLEAEVRKAEEEALKLVREAQQRAEKTLKEADEKAQRIIEQAQREAERLRRELEDKRKELKEFEDALFSRERQLERKWETIERREEEIYKREKEAREFEKQVEARRKELLELEESLQKEREDLRKLKEQETLELQRIASMTMEEAREELMKKVEEESKLEAVKLMKKIEEEAKEKAEREAKRIVTTAVQRVSPQIAINYTTTSVELPSNEFKGRIIGREGRNIRTFELLTGVDLIIDDTPDVVTISSFDPMRREIAKEALERLIEDGRIHPARIEEIVDEVKKEMDDRVRKMGEETAFELGLHDINPGLYYYIGKLYFRTSYSQNVLLHSKEVAYLAGLMAEEMGLDAKLARRAGLLHDVGKAVSHELGGSHTDIGVELCKKYGEPDAVINAIKAHHEEEPVRYPEVALVCAADALSAARPGARRETLEAYLKRLEKLEEIVKSFSGVANAYAVQAGREVRVIVNPDEITDEEAYMLSRDIAKKIEEEMDYPGQIKVVVIRELRHVEYAK
ncbi:ribonuclease Y [Hydrogenivirga sp.]